MSPAVGQAWPAVHLRGGRQSPAIGPEAQRIGRMIAAPTNSAWHMTMQGAMRELQDIASEACRPGWDGYDAEPVTRHAKDAVTDALASLTPHVPVPEITPEPDGGIALEWSGSREQSLIVSFGPDGNLYFAIHLPQRRSSGRHRFDGQIPADLLAFAREAATHGP